MSPASKPSPWWDPSRHADRRPFLAARGRIKAAIRAHFEALGFTEVEPACLAVSPGNEAHLHAFRTRLVGTDLAQRDLYLHTSPEFACKKLLAAGERRIFTFAPVFRNRERGPLHHPEFTMLEWYRADPCDGPEAHYELLWEDCAAILRLAARACDRRQWLWKERGCDPSQAPRPVSVADAFERHAGIRLLEDAYDATGPDRDRFAEAARRAGLRLEPDDTWSDIFSRVLAAFVEPRLGLGAATILHGYPLCEAALARPCPADPRLAERFELYACGIELANGFGELTDAGEQRRRFEAEMTLKQRIHGERYPIDEDFLAALAHMPPAAGCAMGFDRLVMLATGATRIEQVIWTPLPEAGEAQL